MMKPINERINDVANKARRRKLRRLKKRSIPGITTPKEESINAVKNSHINYVLNHPKLDIIRGALVEGIAVTEIARWFAEQGWLTSVNEKTFREYLYTFKARFPEVSAGGETNYIDSLIDAHKPNIDVEVELNRLLRLQKLRLKIDVGNEQNFNKLLGGTHKEVEVTMRILEQLGKLKGQIGGTTSSGKDAIPAEASDSLRRLMTDEAERDKMFSLTEQLVSALSK